MKLATRFREQAHPPMKLAYYIPTLPTMKLPAAVMVTSLIMIIYSVDEVLHRMLAGTTQDKRANFSVEIIIVMMAVILPALYMKLVSNRDGSRSSAREASPAKVLEADRPETACSQACANSAAVKPKDKIGVTASKIVPPVREQGVAPLQRPQHCQSRDARALARLNQAINSAAKAGEPEKAEQLLEEIVKAGLQPDIISYNSVIHASAKQGDIKRAEWWLAAMRDGGAVPNTISYNILIDTCVKAGDSQAAENWLARMIYDGVEANEVSYATVIHAHTKRGEIACAEQWLRKMIQAGFEPSTVSHNSFIYACD